MEVSVPLDDGLRLMAIHAIDHDTESFIGEPVDDLRTIEIVIGFGRSGKASKYRKWAVNAMRSFADDFGT